MPAPGFVPLSRCAKSVVTWEYNLGRALDSINHTGKKQKINNYCLERGHFGKCNNLQVFIYIKFTTQIITI